MKWAYYNEHDAFAAAWLRKLIAAGAIAPGEVDERDIQLVTADELSEFTQCHFFAGIGVWSYALRCAGWPDDKPVWTGSCPCQPFSVSGKRAGASDGRHLWPVWFPLIRESRPELVFGEQVASDDGLAWLDLVSSDLEGQGYTVGAVDTCAAGFGAPHIRQRLYFCADAENADGRSGISRTEAGIGEDGIGRRGFASDGATGIGEHADELRRGRRRLNNGGDTESGRIEAPERSDIRLSVEARGNAGDLCDSDDRRLPMHGQPSGNAGHPERAIETSEHFNAERTRLEGLAGDGRIQRGPGWLDQESARSVAAAGATGGFWRDCSWWWGRDGKWRPIEPGLFPLAHGSANRVGRLRGYGNALCAEQAIGFIEACIAEQCDVRE